MAKRPIFITEKAGQTLVREQEVEFVFSNGFSLSQKQKSIESLHDEAYEFLQLEGEILEVSTKSIQPIGTQLSAFNLSITTESYGEILLEAAFQGSKVFETFGQDTDLYRIGSGSEIKKRMREKADDKLMMFSFDGDDWMLEPKTAFYDWIYLQALKQRDSQGEITTSLKNFSAFTDIEFNPKRSINCQARSCALFVALRHRNILDEALADKDSFLQVLKEFGITPAPQQTSFPV